MRLVGTHDQGSVSLFSGGKAMLSGRASGVSWKNPYLLTLVPALVLSMTLIISAQGPARRKHLSPGAAAGPVDHRPAGTAAAELRFMGEGTDVW